MEDLFCHELNIKIVQDSRNEYKCEFCQYSFQNRRFLRKHTIEFHQGLICNLCHKIFFSQEEFQKHKMISHPTGPLIHKCELCAKSFEFSNELTLHTSKFCLVKFPKCTGWANFSAPPCKDFSKCEECGLEFKSINLESHISSVHRKQCVYCKKNFASVTNLGGKNLAMELKMQWCTNLIFKTVFFKLCKFEFLMYCK